MVIPVFLFLCDVCESESAMGSDESKLPAHWRWVGGELHCGPCVLEEEEHSLHSVPTGVALTQLEACP